LEDVLLLLDGVVAFGLRYGDETAEDLFDGEGDGLLEAFEEVAHGLLPFFASLSGNSQVSCLFHQIADDGGGGSAGPSDRLHQDFLPYSQLTGLIFGAALHYREPVASDQIVGGPPCQVLEHA